MVVFLLFVIIVILLCAVFPDFGSGLLTLLFWLFVLGVFGAIITGLAILGS